MRGAIMALSQGQSRRTQTSRICSWCVLSTYCAPKTKEPRPVPDAFHLEVVGPGRQAFVSKSDDSLGS